MSGDPYIPAIPRHPPPENFGAGEIWSGVGFPDTLLGTVGDLYVDADTGDLYSKSESGWALSGGGSATIQACLVAQSGGPSAPCAYDFGLGYDNDATSPTAGNFWYWDKTGAAWIPFDI